MKDILVVADTTKPLLRLSFNDTPAEFSPNGPKQFAQSYKIRIDQQYKYIDDIYSNRRRVVGQRIYVKRSDDLDKDIENGYKNDIDVAFVLNNTKVYDHEAKTWINLNPGSDPNPTTERRFNFSFYVQPNYFYTIRIYREAPNRPYNLSTNYIETNFVYDDIAFPPKDFTVTQISPNSVSVSILPRTPSTQPNRPKGHIISYLDPVENVVKSTELDLPLINKVIDIPNISANLPYKFDVQTNFGKNNYNYISGNPSIEKTFYFNKNVDNIFNRDFLINANPFIPESIINVFLAAMDRWNTLVKYDTKVLKGIRKILPAFAGLKVDITLDSNLTRPISNGTRSYLCRITKQEAIEINKVDGSVGTNIVSANISINPNIWNTLEANYKSAAATRILGHCLGIGLLVNPENDVSNDFNKNTIPSATYDINPFTTVKEQTDGFNSWEILLLPKPLEEVLGPGPNPGIVKTSNGQYWLLRNKYPTTFRVLERIGKYFKPSFAPIKEITLVGEIDASPTCSIIQSVQNGYTITGEVMSSSSIVGGLIISPISVGYLMDLGYVPTEPQSINLAEGYVKIQ